MYVATVLFGYDFERFIQMTPNLWLKQYVFYIQMHNPDAINQPKPKPIRKQVTLDQIPFFN